ncbi:MAG: DUF1926 domain-containing protein [Candidatus Omnitrophica bacterium]|nr:DUF1926 domain-containing protein [Candidatus Omnitrophota bacterium]
MGKVYLVFGVHNHQPVGNFDHVFKDAYDHCYHPFLSLLSQFPKIKCSVHNSGPLYDWMLKNAKEYLDVLKQLAKRGQVEIISGGYYEPILPLICDKDKYGQINLMNEFIKKEFSQKPQGIWIAERVWEQYLAQVLHNAGLKYTFLDDTHFRYAGLKQKEFFGYYTTEDDAKPILVFPICKTLRYKVPFSQAHEAIELLNGFAGEEDVLVTLFDDGEKFGLWPNTYEWVYEKEWLKKFFTMLQDSDTIETITPGQALLKFSSQGLVYLPTASYEEMGEWVLEPQAAAAFDDLKEFLKNNGRDVEASAYLRGGYFRNFYRKYSRLNYMHKRMLSLSRKVHAAQQAAPKEALKSLWKAQTNCGYWHGIFGGFYLNHIREAVYRNLIAAENLLDSKHKGAVAFEEEDIDLDGNNEIIVKNSKMICSLSRRGASFLELSLRDPAFNLLNTITRQEESYHAKIRAHVTQEANEHATIHDVVKQKENDLDKFLIYDSYERHGLVDHLLDRNFSLDGFNYQRGMLSLGNDLYDVKASKGKGGVKLSCHYAGKDLDFSKVIEFSNLPGFKTLYTFNKKNALNNHQFGVEFNLSLPSFNDIYRKEKKGDVTLATARAWAETEEFSIIDYHKKILLTFHCDKTQIFTMPVYSVSSSESGFERVYQEISVLFIAKSRNTFGLSLFVEPIE